MREYKGNSIIALPSDYVVIDTETTDISFEYGEIIEVAAIKYSQGRAVEKFTSLVQPTPSTSLNDAGEWEDGYVSEFITDLTGITDDMLATAPKPDVVIPKLLAFLGDSILIGHHVGFDINFLYDAAEKLGLRFSNDHIDTLRIARKIFPNLAHHRLRDIANVCGIEQTEAHRAEPDCIVTAQIYETMRKSILAEGTEECFQNRFKRNYRKRAEMLSSIKPTVLCIDDTNPIYGKVVVFTGALSSMLRQDAYQIVANLGGKPENKITMRTNYLVIGDTEFVNSVKDEKTNKIKTAENYIKKGRDILILSEKSFFDLISDYTHEDSSGSSEQIRCILNDEDIHDEKWVFEELRPTLEHTIKQNNADISKLQVREGKSYASVSYGSQLAFRICCRDRQNYFSIAKIYAKCLEFSSINAEINNNPSDQFLHLSFSTTKDGVGEHSCLLSAVLDCVIDTLPKQFDCCSRYEECSNAMRCLHPNPDMAVSCGYRKIMKKGHIYYGRNKNI